MKKKKKKKELKPWMHIVALFIGVFLVAYLISFLLDSNSVFKSKFEIKNRTKEIEKYQKDNPEIKANGWLRVQGTNIDYPVAYDKEFEVLQNEIEDFVWVLENPKELLPRTVIFGHNIKNVSNNPLITNENHSRFEQLMSFIYYDFAKENQFIQYTKDGKDYVYQIFSVTLIDDHELLRSGNLDKEVFKDYIKQAQEDSFFEYDIEVDENDKIITLVTCTRFFYPNTTYKFKVEGKLLTEDANLDIVDVKERENYKDIKDSLKGGEVDEETA